MLTEYMLIRPSTAVCPLLNYMGRLGVFLIGPLKQEQECR
jgi:hypothetical protein